MDDHERLRRLARDLATLDNLLARARKVQHGYMAIAPRLGQRAG